MSKSKPGNRSKSKAKGKAAAKAKSSAHTDDHKVIGAELKRLRIAAGFNQTQLAAEFGKFQSFVSVAERSDGSRLDLIQLRYWCFACGTTLQAFVAAVEARLPPLGGKGASRSTRKSPKT